MSASVTNGAFSVVLNSSNQFGSGAFTGDARWLQTEVRCPNSGPLTLLGRTQITPVPYATYAMDAADSERLGGFLAEDFTRFARIVHVKTVGPTDANGDALETAVAGITGTSQLEPVVVLLEPGTYDVDIVIDLPPYVTLTGLGREATVIRGSVVPVVELDQQSTISNLAVEAVTGPAVRLADGAGSIRSSVIRSGGTGIHVPVPPTFAILELVDTRVDMFCTSAIACIAVEMEGFSTLNMTRSVLSVSALGSSTAAHGVLASTGLVRIADSSFALAGSGAVPATGISTGASGTLEVHATSMLVSSGTGNVAAITSSANSLVASYLTATIFTGGTGTGINSSGSLALQFSKLRVTGATRYGILLFGALSNNTIEQSTIDADGAGTSSPAVQSNGTTTIRHSSLIAGASSTSLFVQAGTASTIMTEFRGNSPFSLGTLTCSGSYIGSGFVASGCS